MREGYLSEENTQTGRLSVTSKLTGLSSWSASARTQEAERLRKQHPEAADYLPLLQASQAGLLGVLRGDRTGADVIFPGGSTELVNDLYKGNVQTAFYNELAAASVIEHVAHRLRRYPRAVAQVCEIGAGTGSTTQAVLPGLSGLKGRWRYLFTDLGPAFVQSGARQFAGSGDLEFGVYDIEQGPEAQGYEPHSMDVVLAGNVLHTTRDIDRTLENCAALLKPGGVLVINELTARLDFNTLTFGLTPGWWRFEDEDRRIPGTPLLATQVWRDRLAATGFGSVEVTGIPGVGEADQAQCVIVATAGAPRQEDPAGWGS